MANRRLYSPALAGKLAALGGESMRPADRVTLAKVLTRQPAAAFPHSVVLSLLRSLEEAEADHDRLSARVNRARAALEGVRP